MYSIVSHYLKSLQLTEIVEPFKPLISSFTVVTNTLSPKFVARHLTIVNSSLSSSCMVSLIKGFSLLSSLFSKSI
jgi:hypothetical protein